MTKVFHAIAAAAAAIATPGWAWAQGGTPDPDRYWYGPGMMWGGGYGMIFGPIFMILVLVAVIATVVLIVRWAGGPWQSPVPHHPSGRAPLDILKERFARGEIDKTEFEERRRVLGE
jgi:putative membrane protein